jgi:hypothetical protein
MKKLLLTTVVALTLSTAAQAQVTLDFETWTTQAGPPTYEDPQGWGTFNILYSFIGGSNQLSVTKDLNNPHGGQASMLIQSIALTTNLFSLPDTLGIAFTGSIGLNGISQGFPYTNRPQFFNWYGKYSPAYNNDSAFAFCVLTKWNGTSSDTIAYAGHVLNGPVGFWQGFNDQFYYDPAFNNLIPDTMLIAFSPTDDDFPRPGGYLWVDDISFTGYVDVTETANIANEVKVFPNPSSDITNFRFNTTAAKTIVVYDVAGREAGRYTVENREAKIDSYKFATGIYAYAVLDENEQVINRGKFSVTK